MSAADYAAFSAAHLGPYAADRMQADHFTQEQADEFVRAQTAQTLPQGQETPGHRFFNIVADDVCVGSLWIFHATGARDGFVYDIVVEPQHRRRGHAGAALELAAQLLREEGCEVLGLNVFAHNPGARALYEKLGFAVKSSYMNKPL